MSFCEDVRLVVPFIIAFVITNSNSWDSHGAIPGDYRCRTGLITVGMCVPFKRLQGLELTQIYRDNDTVYN